MFRTRDCILTLVAVVVAGTAIAENNKAANVANQSATGIVSKTLATHTDNEKKASSLSLIGLDGAMHSLENWKGKVIVLNFWATWCSPCLSEIRDFVAYQEQYKTQGLQIIGVGLDEEKKLRNVQRTLEINYPVLVADPAKNSSLMKTWGNSSGVVPYTVVIDREGRVVLTQRGPMDHDTFDENIIPLLDKD